MAASRAANRNWIEVTLRSPWAAWESPPPPWTSRSWPPGRSEWRMRSGCGGPGESEALAAELSFQRVERLDGSW